MRLVSVVFGEKTIGNGHKSKDKFYLNKEKRFYDGDD